MNADLNFIIFCNCFLLRSTVMTSILRQRGSCTDVRSSGDATPIETIPRLHYYHEIDEWQQDNHFIRSGYVKETSSFSNCFNSLFYLHNESINIHTHLLPSFFAFLVIIYYVNYELPIYDNYLGVWEKLNFLQFGMAVTACLLISSTYHCVKSHSDTVSKLGNKFDYFGIVILITCSLNSIVLFSFYDEPFWKFTFIIIFLGLATTCTVLTLDPRFATNVYRPLRSLMFILFGLSGILPLIAAVKLYGYSAAVERSCAGWLVLEGISYISGAVLYAMRVPERFTHVDEDETSLLDKPLSGKFDIFGHSHQIFHVMVLVGAFCHWMSLVGCYHYLHEVILPNAI